VRNLGLIIISILFVAGCSGSGKKADKAGGDKAAAKSSKSSTKTMSAADKAAAAEKVECVTGNDKREIALIKPEAGGCEVHYQKFGQNRVAASAKRDTEHCTGIYERIKGNLESAGFVCK
jgi:PBP1b-binding outer membrane lipoprotein LpoB